MPRLVRLYIRQVITGFGLSALFVAALLYYNVANLWHLVSATEGGALAVVMLWVFNGIVFAGVQFAITIMRMAEDEPPAGGKRQEVMVREPVAVPVVSQARRGVLRR